MIWNSIPTRNGRVADVVVGQADFVSTSGNQGGSNPAANTLRGPNGLYSDGTRLFIADTNNRRVLIYNTIPTTNNASADVVVGQADFVSNSINQGGSAGANTLNSPRDIHLAGNRLIISDANNNRVLIYNTIPTTNNASADVVIGQPNFTNSSSNQGGNPAANTLNQPIGIYSDGSRLFVADRSNERALIWNSIPTTNNASADVVIGQPNFTSSSANQGGSIKANTVSGPWDFYTYRGRLFLSDSGNHRVLIFNSIPTTNNASADVVLGQANFTSGSANQGGAAAANTFNAPRGIYADNERLIISEIINQRILIFPNVITTPLLNMDSPEDIGGGVLRFKGNIILGERPHYSMQWVKGSVNGDGATNVTYLGSGRDDGPGESRYEWYDDISPNNKDTDGYTLKITASSFNADSSSLFFFSPFKFLSFSDGPTQTVKFSVPTKYIQQVKDNVSHFEVWSRGEDDGWKLYVSNISTSDINTTTGEVTYSFTKSISGGKTDFKIVSVSKDSNWRFDSNTLTQTISGPKISADIDMTSSSNSPLQINNVGGSIVSTYNLSGVKEKYTLSSKTPIFKGIAYANSTVKMVVTNNVTGEERTYSVKVNSDSSFVISPILFPNSTITVYLVDPLGNFAILPSFGVGS